MATYSFLDVQASFTGPNAAFSLGSGAGAAEEGITTAFREEKSSMTIGADGSGMHNLHGGNSGRVTVRLLKTSPTNALLSAAYNFQRQNSANWGQNVIVVSNVQRGDVVTAKLCAFVKHPDLTYAKDGGTIEWEFDAIRLDELIGAGVPDVNI